MQYKLREKLQNSLLDDWQVRLVAFMFNFSVTYTERLRNSSHTGNCCNATTAWVTWVTSLLQPAVSFCAQNTLFLLHRTELQGITN
jgi:hypothetical protein